MERNQVHWRRSLKMEGEGQFPPWLGGEERRLRKRMRSGQVRRFPMQCGTGHANFTADPAALQIGPPSH